MRGLAMFVLIASMGLAVLGCKRSDQAPGPSADSTPEEVLRSFSKAINDGDVATAKALASPAPEQQQAAEGYARMTAAMRNLVGAVNAKFGQTPEAQQFSKGFDEFSMATTVPTLPEFKITGDKAVLVPQPQGDGSVKVSEFIDCLLRSDGKWRVQMKLGDRYSVLGDPREAALVAPIYDEVAQEIKDGKRVTVADAMRAIQEKLSAIAAARKRIADTTPEPLRRQVLPEVKALAGDATTKPASPAYTELMLACGDKDAAKLKSLLEEKGLDPNARGGQGQTVLWVCARDAQMGDEKARDAALEMARILLAHKADPNATDRDGDTVLYSCAFSATEGDDKDRDRAVEVARFLLEHKADPNCKTANGQTPLSIVNGKNPKMVKLLLEHGATE